MNHDLISRDAASATPNPCEDAISRQAAISDIQEMAEWHTEDAFNADRVIQHLKDLPPVTPKQRSETVTEFADRCRECGKMRKGHWIDTDSKSFEFHRVYKCSECGNTEIEHPEDIRRHFRYCPNCGVKMVEPQESEEQA